MKSVLVRTSGDRDHGMGHVVRQTVLADELIERGIRVAFGTEFGTPGYYRIKEWSNGRNIPVNDEQLSYDAVIIDVEHGPTERELRVARDNFNRVIVVGGVGFAITNQQAIDDLVDLQIYQSVLTNSRSKASNILMGCKYLILNRDYHLGRQVYGSDIVGSYISIIMGGADPHELTETVALRVLGSLNGKNRPINAVLGPASTRNKHEFPTGINIDYAPSTLFRTLMNSRCAVTALGMTTYEAACLGVPTASIAWSADHLETAIELERRGITFSLGLWNNIDWGLLRDFILDIDKQGVWQRMNYAGRELVDGLGAGRVASAIERII